MSQMRVAAVTLSRDQGPFLLEWIAWHRMIGVSDFIVFLDDTGDGSAELLAALAAPGWLAVQPAPEGGLSAALTAARAAGPAREAEYVLALDPCEFVNIHAGQGQIADLVAACGNADLVSLCWQVFGHCGVPSYEPVPRIARFTRTHNPDIIADRLSIETRTLARADLPILALGPHRPYLRIRRIRSGPAEAQPRWTDGSGRPVPKGFYTSGPDAPVEALPAAGTRMFATVNRYALGDLETHIALNATMTGGRIAPGFDETDWRDCSDDGWKDTSALRRLPALEQAIAELLTIEGVAEAQAACVARHRARIATVRQADGYEALAKRLRDTPHIPAAELAVMKLLGVA